MSTQFHRAFSVAPLVNLRALGAALLSVVDSNFKCRPEPRLPWDELARNMESRSQRLFAFVPMLRSALRAAHKQGLPDALKTEADVRAFLATLEAEIFAGYERPVPKSRMQAARLMLKELNEANEAFVNFAAEPTPQNEAIALEEVSEAGTV